MNWQQALQNLADGHDVYRDSWEDGEYLSPDFASQVQFVSDPEAWPYVDNNDSPFRLKMWPEGDVYDPAKEDLEATDWELG